MRPLAGRPVVEGEWGHPDPHGFVVGGGGEHEGVGGVPGDAVDCAGVALQLRQQIPALPVPYVHPAVLHNPATFTLRPHIQHLL